jgi:hypothetical protein
MSQRGMSTIGAVSAVSVLVLILAAAFFSQESYTHRPLKFETTYQAVLLSNGSVYFGKLEGYGTRFPLLRDVFYIQSGTNPDTKQTTNVLVKRGKELHGPDRMYLNPTQIILVEPVGPDSKVAQLIAEQKKQQ